MNLRPFLAISSAAILITVSAQPILASRDKAIETVQKSTQLFSSEMSAAKTRIPRSVLRNALGIAIIPNVVKAGFIVGGTRGTGVLSVREPNGRWSNPAFLNLTAGSVGFQVGAQSSDVIIVFNSKASLQKALTEDFDIGGNVSATAGPEGVTPVDNSSTIPDVYTYVRNREGLFAGVSLQGSKLGINSDRNRDFYNQPEITTEKIFT
ncbi:MAG: lipid-binding SYLF domain-containing protein, partial [Thermosynechococcaceae cyanobacterium]